MGPTSATGSNAGRISATAPSLACAVARCLRASARISASAADKSCAALPRENRVAIDAVALEHIERHIELLACGVPCEIFQNPRDAIGDAGIQREQLGSAALVAENFSRHGEQRRLRLDAVDFQIGHRRHRLVVEVEDARVDQGDEPVGCQPIARQRFSQRGRYRMRGGFAVALARKRLAPPLQADFTRHRLAR